MNVSCITTWAFCISPVEVHLYKPEGETFSDTGKREYKDWRQVLTTQIPGAHMPYMIALEVVISQLEICIVCRIVATLLSHAIVLGFPVFVGDCINFGQWDTDVRFTKLLALGQKVRPACSTLDLWTVRGMLSALFYIPTWCSTVTSVARNYLTRSERRMLYRYKYVPRLLLTDYL